MEPGDLMIAAQQTTKARLLSLLIWASGTLRIKDRRTRAEINRHGRDGHVRVRRPTGRTRDQAGSCFSYLFTCQIVPPCYFTLIFTSLYTIFRLSGIKKLLWKLSKEIKKGNRHSLHEK